MAENVTNICFNNISSELVIGSSTDNIQPEDNRVNSFVIKNDEQYLATPSSAFSSLTYSPQIAINITINDR